MNDTSLAERIHQRALEAGFHSCGIIYPEEVDGFEYYRQKRIEMVPESEPMYRNMTSYTNLKERYPWAKAIVVCVCWLGAYVVPEELKGMYASCLIGTPNRDATYHKAKAEMETWFEEQGIRFCCDGNNKMSQFTSMRYAAQAAGLGIVRKNNGFYTEMGSNTIIVAWLIDKNCRLIQQCNMQPCPEDCNKCIENCPTGALSAPNVLQPFHCVSCITTKGSGDLPEGIQEKQLGTWLWGCDVCTNVCPYNQEVLQREYTPFIEKEDMSIFLPENLAQAPDEVIHEKVYPRLIARMVPSNFELIRKEARRVLRFKNGSEYQENCDE